jgi:hypothetical protein
VEINSLAPGRKPAQVNLLSGPPSASAYPDLTHAGQGDLFHKNAGETPCRHPRNHQSPGINP